jgi:hypothetical protein
MSTPRMPAILRNLQEILTAAPGLQPHLLPDDAYRPEDHTIIRPKTLRVAARAHAMIACVRAGREDFKVTQKTTSAVHVEAHELLVACNLAVPLRRGWVPAGCPHTPWGEYWWPYTVQMLQEMLWARPEFVAGFRHRNTHPAPNRGQVPYHWPDDRHLAWDEGFILAGTCSSGESRKQLGAWMASLAKETAACPG